MSKIQQGLQGISQSASGRLKGVTGVGHTARTIQADNTRSSSIMALSKSLSEFGQVAGQAGQMYVDHRKSTAMDNTKKIMDTMTPEQIRLAREDGTILAQDDPFTKRELNYQLATIESDSVYSEMMQGINDDKLYPDKSSFQKALNDRMAQRQKEMIAAYGIDAGDESWSKGWNSDVIAKNVAVAGKLDARDDKIARNKANLARTATTQRILTDSSINFEQQAGLVQQTIDADIQSGIIRNSSELNDTLINVAQTAANQANGVDLLNKLRDTKVDLFGVLVSYKDALGDAQWATLEAQAKQSVYKNDWASQEDFMRKSMAIDQAQDPIQALSLLNKLKGETIGKQGDKTSTPQLESLMRLEAGIIEKAKAHAAATDRATMKLAQGNNKQVVLDQIYSRRINGEIVSTDINTMPTNDATGKFEPEDEANYANAKMNEINSDPNLSEDQKVSKLMGYVKASPKEGAFRKIFGTLIQDTQQEWDAAVLNPKSDAPLVKLNKLAAIYKQEGSTLDQIYPESAGMFIKLDALSRYGINAETLVNAEKFRKVRSSPEAQREMEADWKRITNDSKHKNLMYLPAEAQGIARTVYDETMYLSGNSAQAAVAVSKYLDKNFVKFDGGLGLVSKNALSFGSDINSYKYTRDKIHRQVQEVIKANPSVDPESLTVSTAGDNIILKDYTGEHYFIYTKDNLQRSYEEDQVKNQRDVKAQQEIAIKNLTAKSKKKSGASSLLTGLFGSD